MAKAGRLVKDAMLRELTEALNVRQNFFVTTIGPLQAAEADVLRKRLRIAEARVLMVKRTLALRGLSELKINSGTAQLFSGSVAMVIPGEDFLSAAKVLAGFAKEHQEQLIVRGAWVDGQLLDQTRFQELASLPSKLQLIAQVVGAIEGPIVELIFTLEGALGELPWILEEAAKKTPAVGPESGPPISAPSGSTTPAPGPTPPSGPAAAPEHPPQPSGTEARA